MLKITTMVRCGLEKVMCLIWIGTCVLAAASLADPDASPSLTAFQLLHRPEGVRTCEPIRIEMCQGIGYNITGVPNLVGHETQSDAELQLRTFLPLIQYGCSPDLRFFLCTVYTPMCTEKVAQLIGPCQSVCESVRSRCQPVLQRFGFSWPPALNCSRFHGRNSNGNMCMGETLPDKDVEGDGKDPSSGVPQKPEAKHPQPAHPRRILPQTNPEFRTFPIDCDDQGIPGEHAGNLFVYVNRTRKCALLCDKDFQFTEKDKRLVDTWLIIWATIGLISSAFVFLTYLVDDTRRFGLDGRHLVTMSSCYGMCCVAYLIRGLAGRRAISCVSVDPFQDAVPDGATQMVLAQEGTVSADCTCLFVLYYYFATAGVAWWLVITFNFLLTSGLDWSGDASQRLLGTVFHIGAWTVPAVQTVVILIRKNIQPSELTGMCHVTSTDPMAVVGFQLAPLIVYSLLGIAFLLGGYLGAHSRKKSVKCIRGQDCRRAKSQNGSSSSCSHLSNKSQTKSTPSSEDPIVNVVVLSLLCLIPLVVNIACILFGYITISSPIVVSRVNKMYTSTTTVGFSDRQGQHLSLPHVGPQQRPFPTVSVFMIQILTVVAVCFIAAVALLGSRTVRSWEKFLATKCTFRRAKTVVNNKGNTCQLPFISGAEQTNRSQIRHKHSLKKQREQSILADPENKRYNYPPVPVHRKYPPLVPDLQKYRSVPVCQSHRSVPIHPDRRPFHLESPHYVPDYADLSTARELNRTIYASYNI